MIEKTTDRRAGSKGKVHAMAPVENG